MQQSCEFTLHQQVCIWAVNISTEGKCYCHRQTNRQPVMHASNLSDARYTEVTYYFFFHVIFIAKGILVAIFCVALCDTRHLWLLHHALLGCLVPLVLFILQQYISRALDPPSLPVLSRLCKPDCDVMTDKGGRHGWAGCNSLLRAGEMSYTWQVQWQVVL